jgi:Zn-dependent protease
MDHPTAAEAPSNADAGGALGRAWRIGTVAGIALYVHWTFPLLLLWVAVGTLLTGDGVAAAASALALVLAVFAAVVLHELGHALVARRLGIGTLGITLLPFGGVSRLAAGAGRPRDELLVALAGPLVSLALALLLLLGLVLAGGSPTPGADAWAGERLVARLAWINALLAAFNLLPAFPLDGGRVLRAALATRWSAVRATRVAATVGQGLAVALGLAGLAGNPMLVVIGVFVWVAARREVAATEQHERLRGVTAAQAMMTAFVALPSQAPLRAAVDQLLATPHDRFPVVDADGAPTGVITRDDVVRGLLQLGADAPVAAVERPAAVVAPGTPIEGALAALDEAGTVLVVEDGRLLGVITADNVGELLVLAAAAQARRPGPGRG